MIKASVSGTNISFMVLVLMSIFIFIIISFRVLKIIFISIICVINTNIGVICNIGNISFFSFQRCQYWWGQTVAKESWTLGVTSWGENISRFKFKYFLIWILIFLWVPHLEVKNIWWYILKPFIFIGQFISNIYRFD